MIMLYSVLFQEREAVWVSRRRTVLFSLLIYHCADYQTDTRPVILRKFKYLYKNQYFYKNIIPLSIRVLDLFFLENHDISIRIGFCQKKITL